MDIAKFFIAWGPTFLFIVIVLFGILIGCLRGFRKSLILFIHMLAASVICLVVYLCIVNNPNLDANMVGFVNGILGKFGTSLQKILSVDEGLKTLHEMTMQKILLQMKDNQSMTYWLIQDNAAYINTLVDMAYHLVIAILCSILYGILIFVLYLIYLIAYPVRRKIKKETKKYQNGEINHPYKRRRLLGSLIGGVRSTLTAIVCFSFLGSLIFILTGGTNLPQRDEIKDGETVEFEDKTWNEVYDYYSYVCAMGNTGIFQVLNSVKDTNKTPFYFYFADIVLQGRIHDETLDVENEKFYLRDEMGEYIHFINSTIVLMLKYGNPEDLKELMSSSDNNRQMEILISTMGNEGFAEEFSELIDEFEGKPFMTNLCLSSLTSLVNHIEEVTENENVVGLVNQLFKSEDAIQVSDLATEADVKNLFKGLVQVVADVNASQPEVSAYELSLSEEESSTFISTKQAILIAKNFIPTIQGLSLFNTRQEVGNKIIQGLYTYASNSLVEEEIEFEVPENINWIEEFNILLNACDPLLSIVYEVYDGNSDVMVENLAYIFERENASQMEKAFDDLSDQLIQSSLLDVVFKSSIVGDQIDKIVISIANDETAKIPSDIDYVGKEGECSILLSSLKILLKNGGGPLLLTMMKSNDYSQDEQFETEEIKQMIEVLVKEVTVDGKPTTIIKTIIESKLVYYLISTFLIHADFGDGSFKLYIPEEAVEIKEECTIIRHSEIEVIADLLSNCVELIVEVIDHPQNLDYANIFSNQYIRKTVNDSLLLQGTLANVLIGLSASQEQIVLPITFDDPESWLNEENKKGEICNLLDVIFNVSEVVLEDGKYLINEIMNGTVQPSVLLQLERNILEKLCSSKVLRYTISDMVTDLNGFNLVVARASLEEVNALTTTDKTVNVIQSEELCDIFVDIQRIIYFDDAGEVKVNYGAIFENKAELSKSKTITATLIQLMLDKNEAGFLVIPEPYKIDFEKFKTDLDLSKNKWLGATDDTLDDELYLMLTAVETFIDKDENGKIPADFDFDTLQDDLKLRENGIEDICSSAVLNASLSKRVIDIFHVPTALYQNELVERDALDDLFKAIFKLFNRNEIVVKELDSDLFDLTFKEASTPVILNSVILSATISNKMSRIEQIYVPLSDTEATEFVDKEDGYIVEKSQLTKLFNAMFKIFGTDTIMVNDLDKQLTSLDIKRNSIEYITDSHILAATVSMKLSENNQMIILKKDTKEEQVLNGEIVHTILSIELTKLLNVMFTILQTDSIAVDDMSNEFNNLTIAKKDVELMLDSNIIAATVSHNLVETEELFIPLKLITEEKSISDLDENLISKTELHNLFSALFVLMEKESLKLLNLNTNLENIELTSSKVNTVLESEILQVTISDKLIAVEDLVIPSIVASTIDIIKDSTKVLIEKMELISFFDALFATTDGTINASSFELSQMILPTTERAATTMTRSIIVSSTLSSKIMVETSSICVIDEMKVFYQYQDATTTERYIEQTELSNLLLSLTVGIGLNDPTNLSFDEIAIPQTEAEKTALVNSEIIRATISQKVLDQETVGIDATSTNLNKEMHYNGVSVGILSKIEILNIIRGVELLNPDNGNFDHLVLDVGKILEMPNKEEVLRAISESDIYQFIISRTLGEDKGLGVKAYEWFTTASSTATIDGIEYVYQASRYPGRFNIQYPTTPKNVYTSFDLGVAEAYVLNKMDILALQYTLQTV